MKTLLKNGQTVDRGNTLKPINILVEDGKITEISSNFISENQTIDQVLDIQNQLILPGLVDIHVHLRQPGFEYKETIKTGTLAAAHGGFTTVCAMPNLNPVPDTPEKMAKMLELDKAEAVVNVLQYASITKERTSEELVDFTGMANAGAFAFSNDGSGVQTANCMYQAMKEAKRVNKAIAAHIEDESLMNGGVMHEGKRSRELGIPGMPSVTETAQLARDLVLAEATGVHYHVCHVSAKASVRLIREAKRAGIHVTAEVAPHHLILSDEDIPYDTAIYKMNPPLPGREDQEALIEGLLDGTIDLIATDHAPHSAEEKEGRFVEGAFGIVGSETAFSLMYTHFVEKGIFTLEQLVNWMSLAPAKLFNIDSGVLKVGDKADLAVFNIEQEYVIDAADFESKGKNTPFLGETVKGETQLTMVNGKIVWQKK
ncbi:MAG: dihydroorotase [Streptococcaceae bacterium]|jgi:dihydroorotase|nr:dihydroorotase [Streptococcaceae bacterium]